MYQTDIVGIHPGRSSPAFGCQDHAACLKISYGSFHLKSIKTTHSHNLGIQDPYSKCSCLGKTSFEKFSAGQRLLQSVIVLDLLRFFQLTDSCIYDQRIHISSCRIKCCRDPGRTCSYDNDILHFRHLLSSSFGSVL